MFETDRFSRPGADSSDPRTPVRGRVMGDTSAARGAGDLRDQAWDRLEPVLELFERALNRGERPDLQAFVPALDPPERQALLAELVHAELEYRLEAAEPARVEEYLKRFPELRSNPALVLDLI